MKYSLSVVLSLFALGAVPAMADTQSVGATKDATVVYNLSQCGDTPCALINHGMEPTLSASQQNGEAVRILLGFTLPAGISSSDSIASCQLQMQRPVQGPSEQYGLTASQALGDWDQATVNGLTNLPTGKVLGSVRATGNERPGAIDVTDACKDAANDSSDGSFSLWVDTSGPVVMFPSMKTGAASILRVFTQ
ncbi:hypothetical protein GGI20_002579 [Coemansia sp. BCRC 34301]|nr:hypothetical protein GGI20_002579 [Coemansia sp. BCRC 34301]